MRKYDLLAVDLDGTLLDHSGKISEANVAALARARREGLHVTLCTGRAMIECREIARRVGQEDPCIVSGGAMVVCPRTEQTLERFAMGRELVGDLVAYLAGHGHPALLLKDPAAAGFDYLVIGPGGEAALDPASRWWFERMGVRARYAERLEDDAHPEHTVRVGAYSANEPVDELALSLRDRYGAVAMLQHFTGVLLPAERRLQGIESIHIVELFDPSADKWLALQRLAARMGVPEGRTAAIGDQTNDLSMITHAGLGIAMGNAHPRVKAAADRETRAVHEDGLAWAIERVLSGEW